jgi:hypothetical protein
MYRILTEDVNRDGIFALLDSRFDGYTVTPSLGVWKGKHEASLAIDLVNVERIDVYNAAEAIKELNSQDAVLVVEFTAQSIFI